MTATTWNVLWLHRVSGDLASPRSLSQLNGGLVVHVEDVDAHFARARAVGAVIDREPEDQPYGQREYGACDLEGHHWWFRHTYGCASVARSIGDASAARDGWTPRHICRDVVVDRPEVTAQITGPGPAFRGGRPMDDHLLGETPLDNVANKVSLLHYQSWAASSRAARASP